MLLHLVRLSPIVSVLMISGIGFAQQGQPATSPPPTDRAQSAALSDPTLCWMIGPPTGSRLGSRKICHKQSEWQQLDGDTRDSINKLQMAGTLSNPGGG
jgi:hypothetical protein